ncbi:hypothetical protein [Streptomyces sp. SCSIO ZS0520]|uniref:hypothetical protein n=1 Tax=Streptomyces sp. SCSIO ZS0520 TaxID=2892996 RepID=UPI0021D9BAC7|nr:hypothetical protein [Streptomyces sp. SCSIO ZS0520]
MTRPQDLAAIELLCSGEFPAEHSGSGAGFAGPGYRMAYLGTQSAEGAEAAGGTGAGLAGAEEYGQPEARVGEVEQCEAEREALRAQLTARWGAPGELPLDGLLLRSWERAEEIPEPWKTLSEEAGHLYLWRTAPEGRWLGLGITRTGPEQEPRLLAVVTETDPP